MEFHILGTVAAELDGHPIQLVRRQVRYLLALLLLEIGQPVPAERLASLLWPGRQPHHARAVLHTSVARLRSALADAKDVQVERHGDGYRLSADPESVDAHRFRRMVDQARSVEDPAERAELIRCALALWRGPALADVAPDDVRDRLCAALNQARRQALRLRLSAELELGRHEQLLGELIGLHAQDPLDEQLTGFLVLALYRSGRRHEALEVYRRTRDTIADQLGLDPGPALRDLEVAILRSAPSLDLHAPPPSTVEQPETTDRPARRPAQLPTAIPDFAGRRVELARLDAHLAEQAAAPAGAALICVVCGPAGVGKTALAVHWCHRAGERFPDGRLYANLRGYDEREPLRPIEVLARFLRSLGVEPNRVPLELEEATTLYRTLLAGRRMLVLLDNARSVEQVRPLLPNSTGCAAVVTSRDRLTGLIAREGARRIMLDVLSPAESADLLSRVLDERATGEPEAVAALAVACGRLPLALRIAAAQLVDSPDRTIAAHVAELEQDRLSALRIEGDEPGAVEATFTHSYAILPRAVGALFRLLGLVPGPDFTAASAAALAGMRSAEAARLLDQLAGAHLVEANGPGRFAFHDLLRLYARKRSTAEDPPASRAAALERLLEFYLSHMDAAARLLYPQMLRLPLPDLEPVEFADAAEARAWVDAERLNLLDATLLAAERGPARMAWLLADVQRGYFWLTQNTVDWLAVGSAALAAARTMGDLQAQAACHLNLGLANMCVSQYEPAAEHNLAALQLSERAGWREGQAAARGSLGTVYLEWGQLEPAAENYSASLRLNTELGRPAAAATNRGNVGLVHMLRGRLHQAAHEFSEALAFQRSAGILPSQALNLNNLGDVYRQLGELDRALECLTEGVELHRRLGNSQGEAAVLAAIAAVHRDAGRSALALETVQQALKIVTTIADPSTESDVRATHASIQLRLGMHRQAVDEYAAALELATEIGGRYEEAVSTIGLAAAQLAYGMVADAWQSALRGVELSRSSGYRLLEGQALTALAAVELSRGEPERAQALATDALRIKTEAGEQW